MVKTKEFKVVNKRFQFTCPHCGGRRSFFTSNIRRKNIKCYKCGENTRGLLNRRMDKRDYQAGRVILVTQAGKEVNVFLKNLSFNGAGLEIPPGIPTNFLSIGQEISLKCSWNAQLIRNRRYVIQNINGQHVGIKKAFR